MRLRSRRHKGAPPPPAVSTVQSPATPDPQLADASPSAPRVISNLVDLDVELVEVDKAFAISDDAGLARLAEFQFALDGHFPEDPYSAEYREAQYDIYKALTGRRSYVALDDERSSFDLEYAKTTPYPYHTRSPHSVGNQLIAWGYIIREMDLPEGSSVLEFGPGWGNTTLNLAQMGYQVTAVEVDESFTELIRDRARRLEVPLDVVHADMATFESNKQYDAVLFFECFHHCADHLGLLERLPRLVAPDGILVFASEPIVDFPHPWGFVRTDGMTLWSIRKFGWFELGFDTSYFVRTLLRFGWIPRHRWDDVSTLTNMIIARRSQGVYPPGELLLPPDESVTWGVAAGTFRYVGPHSKMTCELDREVDTVVFSLSNHSTIATSVTVESGDDRRTVLIPPNSAVVDVTLEVRQWVGSVAVLADSGANTIAVHQIELR
jgi:SAM-dependent methyltransferase